MKQYETFRLTVHELDNVDVVRTSEPDKAGDDAKWVIFQGGNLEQ